MNHTALFTIDQNALKGLPGEIVGILDQYTEADRAGLLGQLLTTFGNACGKGRHLRIEEDTHGTNLFLILFGDSSNGRKGTSLSRILRIMEDVDESWRKDRVKSGLVSGEGLIHHVRDGGSSQEGAPPCDQSTDKRLLITETEFAQVLSVMSREGNTLSAVLRNAWDGKDLTTLAKNSPEVASNAHISIVGHITSTEVVSLLSRNESANGFGNRFLWCKVRRSKVLPFPKSIPDGLMRDIRRQLSEALEFGKRSAEVRLSKRAEELWVPMYSRLTEERFGILGSMTARAAPQVLRIALIHSIFARSELIEPEHLEAAEAFWNYCDQSCRELFSRRFETKTAETILTALTDKPEGLSRTGINDHFQRNRSSTEITRGIKELVQMGLVVSEKKPATIGRPTEWFKLAPDLNESKP